MGLIQSVEGMNRTEMLRENFLLPEGLELGHQSFLVFRSGLKLWLFLGLKPASFLAGNYTADSHSSQAFRLNLELQVCS